jgi:16S rRNA (guanine966-N2)-methyltransferase
LFDALQSAGRLDGAVVLDLFSGTGSMGLECLSRGAAHVSFVEKDRSTRYRLKRNLATVGVGREGEVVAADALSPALIGELPRDDYSLIFMDPPYRMLGDDRNRRKLTRQMDRLAPVAAAEALLVVRAEEHAQSLASQTWQQTSDRRVGSMRMDYYEPSATAAEA